MKVGRTRTLCRCPRRANTRSSLPRAAEVAPHEGKRKSESIWPILRIHHQRSRYIFEAYYKKQEISKEVYDYCIREGHADANLIAKWRKPGFGSLCCLGCAQTKDHNFGTSCICRVPKVALDAGRSVECKTCGCRGCAGGDEKFQIIDIPATVEARGGLPAQLGYSDTRSGPPAPPAPSPVTAAAKPPAPLAAAGGPPGFFPPGMLPPPEALQAFAAQAAMAQFFAQQQHATAAAGGAAAAPLPPMPPHIAMLMMSSGFVPPPFPAAPGAVSASLSGAPSDGALQSGEPATAPPVSAD